MIKPEPVDIGNRNTPTPDMSKRIDKLISNTKRRTNILLAHNPYNDANVMMKQISIMMFWFTATVLSSSVPLTYSLGSIARIVKNNQLNA